MKKTGIRRCMKALAAAVLLTIAGAFSAQAGSRSEEHTSELPSRTSISYAVFCLKKKHV